MIIDVKKNILIVGLGLIGGRYAEALKRYGFRVTAITRSRKTIDYALNKGLIDEGAAEVDPRLVSEADIVVFALYPHVFIEWIENNQQLFKPGAEDRLRRLHRRRQDHHHQPHQPLLRYPKGHHHL